MGVVGSNILAGSSGAAEDYTIDQSLRFAYGDSGYLGKTFGSSGNRRTFTVSCWVKNTAISYTEGYRTFYGVYSDDSNYTKYYLMGDKLTFREFVSGSKESYVISDSVLRDPAAWYHLVLAVDTSESTPADRVKMWSNGVALSQDINTQVGQDTDIFGWQDSSYAQEIGISRQSGGDGTTYSDMYLADYYYLDGIAASPSDLGKTDTATGQWKPIEYDGSYGTNGFYQKYGSSGGHTSFTSAGTTTWTVPAGITSVDYLVVGGGGSGGSGSGGGGGGAGAYRTGTLSVTPAAELTVTVGAGGAAVSDSIGNDGGSSVFSSITSGGGGGGGKTTGATASSGSGGGGGNGSSAGGSGSYGYNGGSGGNSSVGGGGGGASAVGTAGVGSPYWGYGHGGAGTASSITGSSVTYAAGGGGGVMHSGAGGNGGSYPTGGQGAATGQTPTSGAANTGSGGGGSNAASQASAAGAVGIVIIKPATGFGFGLDSSGEGNNFTETNLVATDQMVDSPTNNWCTLSPLQTSRTSGVTLSEGNLKLTSDDYYQGAISTIAVNSGKWYWELCNVATDYFQTGFTTIKDFTTVTGSDYAQGQYVYKQSNNTSLDGYGTLSVSGGSNAMTAASNGEILQFALDLENGRFYIGKDGTWINSSDPEDGTNYFYGSWYTDGNYYSPFTTNGPSANQIYNFGQDSSFAGNKTAQGNQDSNEIGDFYYEPPTDYLALCTSNLPSPEIALPTAHFSTKLYTGDGATTLAVSGVGFQPDFTWIKNRDEADDHTLVDSVRGATKYLVSNEIDAEVDDSTFVASLDSDGFTVGDDVVVNTSTEDYVSWNWKAGGTAVSNTDGTITSSVSANTTAGFSIVSYTGTGSAATVGHGLSQTPELFTVKSRNVYGRGWTTWADSLTATQALDINGSDAAYTSTTSWNSALPSSSVLNLGTRVGTNESATTYIGYCFHSVEGYSKVGSYTAAGSDGDMNFLYCGFRPAFVLFKETSAVNPWAIIDNKRNTYNLADLILRPDVSDAVYSYSSGVDFVSNGIKLRNNNGMWADAGADYIFYAIAESPFKTSNAR